MFFTPKQACNPQEYKSYIPLVYFQYLPYPQVIREGLSPPVT